MSPTHDLPSVLIQLELSSFCVPTTQHLPRTSHHFVSNPFSPSRASEGLSPPCLVFWVIASLFSVCLLLNMPFLYK